MKKLSAFMKIREFGPARVAAIAAICTGIWFAPPAEGRDLRAVARTMKAPQRTVLKPDANTVAHVYWNGTALVDAKGNAWTMTGTVPMVAPAPPIPAGAGPFTLSDYYSRLSVPTPATALSVCAVVTIPVGGAIGTIAEDSGTNRWKLATTATQARFTVLGVADVTTALNTLNIGGVNVICGGTSGTTSSVKTNLTSLVSATAAQGANAATFRIGRRSSGEVFPGTIHEIWISSTAATDAAFSDIQARAKTKLGVTAW